MSEYINYKEISREGLIDMLEEATDRLQEKSALIRELKQKLADTEACAFKDRIAYGGALGDAIPAGYDGKLSNGIEPVNYIASHLQNELAALRRSKNFEWLEHLMQDGSHDDCPTCNEVTAFLQRLEEKP